MKCEAALLSIASIVINENKFLRIFEFRSELFLFKTTNPNNLLTLPNQPNCYVKLILFNFNRKNLLLSFQKKKKMIIRCVRGRWKWSEQNESRVATEFLLSGSLKKPLNKLAKSRLIFWFMFE